MTHRGPFQPLTFCDSVISELISTKDTLSVLVVFESGYPSLRNICKIYNILEGCPALRFDGNSRRTCRRNVRDGWDGCSLNASSKCGEGGDEGKTLIYCCHHLLLCLLQSPT